MNKTQIEWVKNPDGSPGYTWNPITGCLNHVNGMCKGGNFPCYAIRLANTRLKQRYLANTNLPDNIPPEHIKEGCFGDPFYLRFWPERLYQKDSPRLWETKQKPKGIFVCDMSDLFGIGVPEAWTREIFDYIRRCPNDRFYLLTKQPQNLAKFSPFPDNCWVGVTACNYEMFYRGAIHYLPKIQAKVKYISLEPFFGLGQHIKGWLTACLIDAGINWLIIGAQTKPTVMPKIEWVREIVEAADKAGIPVFLKDNLKPLFYDLTTIKDKWIFSKTNFMKGEFYRQEIPK